MLRPGFNHMHTIYVNCFSSGKVQLPRGRHENRKYNRYVVTCVLILDIVPTLMKVSTMSVQQAYS